MNTPELKNCPFCGGEALLVNNRAANRLFRVSCKNCDASPLGGFSEEEAISAWNRRTNQPSPAPDGWITVPKEPTMKMRLAADEAFKEAVRQDLHQSPEWDAIRAYRAMISAAPAAPNGWQPIETAPKDGTKLLLGLNCISQGGGTKVQVGWWGELKPEYQDQNCLFEGCEGWLGDEWFPGADQPTHWHPLPAAPAEDREND